MTRSAPSCLAASTASSPTAPSPTTATVLPGPASAATAPNQPVPSTSEAASRLGIRSSEGTSGAYQVVVAGSPRGRCFRTDAHLFVGVGGTACRWELSRLLSSIGGGQAAKAKRELAGTEVAPVRGAGLNGSVRESMCQAAIRVVRATAAFAGLWLRERRLTWR